MLIGGLQKMTLIDYPDKIAATVFTVGCNFRCSFCHNPDIVKNGLATITEKEFFDFLSKRKKLLEGIVITGGEPTLHRDLVDFISQIKDMGYLVKLDSNGTKPHVLKRLIKNDLIDYVAMDIKAPWSKYRDVVCRETDVSKIKESVKILKEGNVDYEFRSTVLPELHSLDDLVKMARQIKGAKKYYLQQFVAGDNLMDESFSQQRPYTKKQMNEVAREIREWFGKCLVR